MCVPNLCSFAHYMAFSQFFPLAVILQECVVSEACTPAFPESSWNNMRCWLNDTPPCAPVLTFPARHWWAEGCWGLERDIMSGCEGEVKKKKKSWSQVQMQHLDSQNREPFLKMKRRWNARLQSMLSARQEIWRLISQVKTDRDMLWKQGGGVVAVLPTKKRHYQKPTRQQMFPAAFALQV